METVQDTAVEIIARIPCSFFKMMCLYKEVYKFRTICLALSDKRWVLFEDRAWGNCLKFADNYPITQPSSEIDEESMHRYPGFDGDIKKEMYFSIFSL